MLVCIHIDTRDVFFFPSKVAIDDIVDFHFFSLLYLGLVSVFRAMAKIYIAPVHK